VPPDTTYGVVTDTDPGLVPALPGDPTKFFNGDGGYTVPAGGGGGGGYFNGATNMYNLLASGTNYATTGIVIQPLADCVVDAVGCFVTVSATTWRMKLGICSLTGVTISSNTVTAATVDTILGETTPIYPGSTSAMS